MTKVVCQECSGEGTPIDSLNKKCLACDGIGMYDMEQEKLTDAQSFNVILDTIERAAKRTGVREWYCDGVTRSGLTIVHDCVSGSRMHSITAEKLEAQYIETVNPAIMIALIDKIRQRQKELSSLANQLTIKLYDNCIDKPEIIELVEKIRRHASNA